MKDKYSPLLLSTKGKALVLLGTAGLLAAGIYGVVNVSERPLNTKGCLNTRTQAICLAADYVLPVSQGFPACCARRRCRCVVDRGSVMGVRWTSSLSSNGLAEAALVRGARSRTASIADMAVVHGRP